MEIPFSTSKGSWKWCSGRTRFLVSDVQHQLLWEATFIMQCLHQTPSCKLGKLSGCHIAWGMSQHGHEQKLQESQKPESLIGITEKLMLLSEVLLQKSNKFIKFMKIQTRHWQDSFCHNAQFFPDFRYQKIWIILWQKCKFFNHNWLKGHFSVQFLFITCIANDIMLPV